MRIVEQGDWEYIKFTYEEEMEFAKWVMDVLCLRWIQTQPEFSKLLSKIYLRKCKGKDLSSEDFAELLKFEARYNDDLPDIPLFDENSGSINPPYKNRHGKLTKKDRENYMIHEKVRAWREAWQAHDKIKKGVEGCEVFAGDVILNPEQAQIAYQEAQEARERAFYDEVVRRQAKWRITRQEAIQAVTDTHPRSEDKELRWDMMK